ncbi:hypothetical protein JCM24511_09788 [Saitozyma sp. JCM 24511]|nr:hypothetical protein JCM24511_09788 [Saitozyma sp. JCM 24511]
MSSKATSDSGSIADRTGQTKPTERTERSGLSLFTDLSNRTETTAKSPSSPVSPASEALRRIGLLDEHRSFHMLQHECKEALQRRRSRGAGASGHIASSSPGNNPLTPLWILDARQKGDSEKSALDIYRAQEASEGAKASKLETTVESENEE